MRRPSFRPAVDRCESRVLTTVGLSHVAAVAHPAILSPSALQDNYIFSIRNESGLSVAYDFAATNLKGQRTFRPPIQYLKPGEKTIHTWSTGLGGSMVTISYERIPGDRRSVTDVAIVPKATNELRPDDAFIKRNTVPFTFVRLAGGQIGLAS